MIKSIQLHFKNPIINTLSIKSENGFVTASAILSVDFQDPINVIQTGDFVEVECKEKDGDGIASYLYPVSEIARIKIVETK